ncbi:MAG: MBL fold metallo-hydrolase [Rhodocyclaceae bacterium]|nr:MBL fold metallo-hydrolase [Rhodocyclaceae bacterium]
MKQTSMFRSRYLLCIVALLAACSKEVPPAAPSGDATATTVASNASFGKSLNLAEQQGFEDARRGLIAKPTGKVLAADGSTVWDYDRFAFIQGEAPPSVNPSLWRHATLNNEAGLFKVAEGIHQLRGFDIANITLIDGKTGWILVDPLTTRETAAAALAFARKHLGDKPVTAMIFTHSHVDHFGGALGIISGEDAAKQKLPIVAPKGFMEESTSENILVGPAMGRRATWQFGNLLPASKQGLVNSGLGKSVAAGNVGILPPTIIVDRTPQEMTLDGVRFIFQNAPGSEAPAELAFYLPDMKAYCGAEIMVPTLHNLYTLRGAKVRDSLRWSGYIDDALVRFGDAEVFFASHLWPVWGNANITKFMKEQRDVYKFIHDQTVRMINKGMKPNEIAEEIKLPKSLNDSFAVHGYYGTLKHDSRAVYQFYIGWFDGNPANLDLLPRADAAKRYVELMGGADKAVGAAQAAFDKGDYRWVAELLNHVVFAQPDHKAARELLARSYDQMGYMAESAIWRNFYLTGAQELRTGVMGRGSNVKMATDMLAWTDPESFLQAWAASLNGAKAEGKNLKINLEFTDLKENYVLWIENAVLHFRKAPPAKDANAGIALTKGIFLKMMLGTAGISEMLTSDELKVSGSKLDLVSFFGLLDKPPETFPIISP